jgi:hypothetical protein
MPELRVVAVNEDGTHLVLKSDDGQKYTLAIDERLRAAVRGDRPRLGQIQIEVDSQLRPRDIQARIRSGMTAEEVARIAGISVERVRRFEGPVLAERAYMAERAQKASVRRRSDEPAHSQPAAGQGPILGEIVAEHLKRRGVEHETVQWDSWRRDDGRWEIVLAFHAGTRAATARWSFDPPRRVAIPDDDEARSLCSEEPDQPEPKFPFVPRIAPVPDRRDQGRDHKRDRDSDDDMLALANRTGTARPPAEPAGRPTAKPAARPAAESGTPAVPPAARATPSRAAGSAYADALFGPAPAGDTNRMVGPHRERLTGTTDHQAEADGVRPGRRATVPSWDEIVFGSRRNKKRD